MRLDKKFLARLLGISEREIGDVKGMTFTLANAPEDGQQTFKSLLDDRHNKKIEALATVLAKQDDLGTVVRAHIHIEHELHDFIYFAAPSPAHLKSMDKMEFSEKISLALVLGLNADLKPSLRWTSAFRPSSSHFLLRG
jgi:hypothetical protein